jgi:hypothetical protein
MAATRRSKRTQMNDEAIDMCPGLYMPYQPRRKRLNRPEDVRTCWKINCDDWLNDTWVDRVVPCSECTLYRKEKAHKKNLRKQGSTQDDAPREYQCQTLWCEIRPKKTVADSPSQNIQPQNVQPQTIAPTVVTPTPKKASQKRLKTSHTETNATSTVAISLQKDMYMSKSVLFNKKYYETEIAGLKDVIFDLRRTGSLLQESNLLLNSSLCRLEDSKKTEMKDLQDKTEAQLQDSKKLVFDLRKSLADTTASPHVMFQGYIKKVKESFPKGTWQSTVYREIVDDMWTYLKDDGMCRPYILQKCRETLLPFNPFLNPIELAKMMDLHGAVLNISGLHLLRGVQVEVGRTSEEGSTWITSSYQIKKAMSHLESKADDDLPFRMLDDPSND